MTSQIVGGGPAGAGGQSAGGCSVTRRRKRGHVDAPQRNQSRGLLQSRPWSRPRFEYTANEFGNIKSHEKEIK